MSLCTSYEGVRLTSGARYLGSPMSGVITGLTSSRDGSGRARAGEVAKFGGFETGGDEGVARLDVAMELPGGVKADERAGDV